MTARKNSAPADIFADGFAERAHEDAAQEAFDAISGISDEAAELLATLAAGTAKAAALTPKPRAPKNAEPRTFYDAALLIKLANDLGEHADWLDLGAAYRDANGKNGAAWSDDDAFHGPKLRTRISQLRNAGRIGENFDTAAAKLPRDLYLAEKANAATRRALLAAGMTDEQIDAALAASTEDAS